MIADGSIREYRAKLFPTKTQDRSGSGPSMKSILPRRSLDAIVTVVLDAHPMFTDMRIRFALVRLFTVRRHIVIAARMTGGAGAGTIAPWTVTNAY